MGIDECMDIEYVVDKYKKCNCADFDAYFGIGSSKTVLENSAHKIPLFNIHGGPKRLHHFNFNRKFKLLSHENY